MLAGELVRDGVQRTHPLHRHQERLVLREAGATQRSHLAAQVILQLLHVYRPYGLPAAKVAPPLLDLLLERVARPRLLWPAQPWDGRGDSADRAGSETVRQMLRSAESTICHCWRCSTSCALPRAVR